MAVVVEVVVEATKACGYDTVPFLEVAAAAAKAALCGTKRNFHTETRRNEIQTYHRIGTSVASRITKKYCVCNSATRTDRFGVGWWEEE